MHHAPICPYCNRPAMKTDGADVYKSRRDLAHLVFWICRPCHAYTGCHKAGAWQKRADGTIVTSDGSLPLGRLANRYLRAARIKTHEALDPLWKDHPYPKDERRRIYGWLAEELGIKREECHVGYFDIETCEKAFRLCVKRARAVEEV